MATSVTPAQLVQYAVNIAVPLQQNIQNGVYEDVYKSISDLCTAIIALADACNGNLGTTTVPVPVLSIGGQYSGTQALPANVVTAIR